MTTEEELMKAATEEPAYSDVYYGKCLLTLWEGKFPRDEDGHVTGRPIRWNEGDNPKDRIIMIDFFLDLCPGCKSSFQIKQSFMKHDRDWMKIVLPSLAEAGCVDASGKVSLGMVKDHWCKVQQVEGLRPRDKNDPEKGNWNTYKFLAVYQSEQECLDAMALDNGEDFEEKPAAQAKSVDKREARRQAALEFCKVAIATYKGMKPEEIKKALQSFIVSNANVNPYIAIDDPEIVEMINEASIPF